MIAFFQLLILSIIPLVFGETSNSSPNAVIFVGPLPSPIPTSSITPNSTPSPTPISSPLVGHILAGLPLSGSATILVSRTPKFINKIDFSRAVLDPSQNGIASDASEHREGVEKQFQSYLNFKSDFIKECRATSEEARSPFCTLVLKQNRHLASISGPPTLSKREKRARHKKVSRALGELEKTGKIKALADQDDNDIFSAFKKGWSASRVKTLAKKMLDASECAPNGLLMGLGIKIEDGFPAQESKNMAVALYTKAFQCAKDSFGVHAGYRAGLIHIWENNCDEAEKIFSHMDDNSFIQDYRMRMGYWRSYCAKEKKETALEANLDAWLDKEYPLSLHRIVARQQPFGSEAILNRIFDPPVTFRTLQDNKMNEVVRAAELLMERGYMNSAAYLLRSNADEIKKLEVSFQLYWAILFSRAGNSSYCFQMLATLFRENPELISRSTLPLMYPLKEFELLQNMNLSIDPYLVISLIRQESAFDENARSPAGAFGLMQLQLPTARNFEKIKKKELYNPEINIRVGVKYLSSLIHRNDGQVELALVAYNAGPGRLKEWKKRYPTENPMLFLDLLPVRESREYVSSIIRNYYWYLSLYAPFEAEHRIASQSSHLIHLLATPKVEPQPK